MYIYFYMKYKCRCYNEMLLSMSDKNPPIQFKDEYTYMTAENTPMEVKQLAQT